MAAARQHLAQAGLVAVSLLAGCGSPAPPPHGGPTLRLALPLVPRTLDPARAPDLPALNVAHELYAGLTRFSGSGVVPDLAQSWDVQEGGLVWTFHLRKGLRWSDDRPITAQDFRRSWLRALAPETKAPFAGPMLGIVRDSRGYHATGRGEVGVSALDDRTLRVTLQHPIPWLDQLVAHPIAFPVPTHRNAYSGPFRLASRSGNRLVLERNFYYWNVRAVKPAKLVLTTATKDADAILPRGTAPPGQPWIETAARPTGPGWKSLATLNVHLLWILTRRPGLETPQRRLGLVLGLTTYRLPTVVPPAMPGYVTVTPRRERVRIAIGEPHLNLTLAYTSEDPTGAPTAAVLRNELSAENATIRLIRFPTLQALVQAAGPPARSDIDLVLLGWSSKIFDSYNTLDLFTCGSAFNIAQWCEPSYDRLMREAVRTLDDHARWQVERKPATILNDAIPAVGLFPADEHVHLEPGVRGFSWSPIGFYELDGMTRS
jgi:ABC-type transport system substrate-binding protein